MYDYSGMDIEQVDNYTALVSTSDADGEVATRNKLIMRTSQH